MLQTCYYTLGKFVSSSHPYKPNRQLNRLVDRLLDRLYALTTYLSPMHFVILKMLFGCHVLEGTFSGKAFLGELLNFWILTSTGYLTLICICPVSWSRTVHCLWEAYAYSVLGNIIGNIENIIRVQDLSISEGRVLKTRNFFLQSGNCFSTMFLQDLRQKTTSCTLIPHTDT